MKKAILALALVMSIGATQVSLASSAPKHRYHPTQDFDGLMSSMMNDEAFLKQAGDKAGAFVASLSGATGKVLAKIEL